MLVNAWWEAIDFVLPDTRPGAGWHAEVDTFSPGALDPGTLAGPAVAGRAGDKLAVGPRSVVVLRSPPRSEGAGPACGPVSRAVQLAGR